MNTYREFLKILHKFRDDYRKDLQELINRLRIAYIEAWKYKGLSRAQDAFIEVENNLQELTALSGLGTKIREVRHLGSRLEKELLISNQNIKNGDDAKAVDNVKEAINELVDFLNDIDRAIIEVIKLRHDGISNCPYGQAENSVKNALDFQRNVIELLSWLFIDDMRLLEKEEIEQDQLIRDGIFEIEDGFDFSKKGVEKIRFSHVLVECKNYRKPSYDDLMQIVAYTFLNKVYPLVNKPLCLLVSRENPSKDSITTKMRDKLFEKDGQDFLLVLFLSCEDLSKMVELRRKSGDPFLVLSEQIKQILRDNITSEA